MIRLGEQAAAKYADGLVVVSDDLRQYFQNTYSRDARYIPNAPGTYAESDPSFAFGKSLGLTQGKYMVYVGRLVPEKCPDLLINAFKQLKKQVGSWCLLAGAATPMALPRRLSNWRPTAQISSLPGNCREEALLKLFVGLAYSPCHLT